MTDTPAIPLPDMPDRLHPGSVAVIALGVFALSALLAGICRLAAGPTLGLFLGPPFLLCIFVPQIITVIGRATHRWLVWLFTTLGTATIWYSALPDIIGTTARQVSMCVIVLSALLLLLIALTDLLLWPGIRPTAAAALVTLICLVWLSWPIWLSGHLAGEVGENVANRLVYFHPLFAMNAALHFDLWDHFPFMYSTLSSLNQDVSYRIPSSIWPAVLIHAIPATLLLVLHPLFARHKKPPITNPV